MVTVPETVAPLAGPVIATVGATMSPLATVTVTGVEVVVLPAASRARAVSVWLAVGGRGGVPRHAVGRAGVLGEQRSAVRKNCTPADADVVGGGGGEGDGARHGRAVGGSGDAHRGCRDVRVVDGDGHRRRGGGVAGGVAGNCGQRVAAVGGRVVFHDTP